jgi:hypothetical protein
MEADNSAQGLMNLPQAEQRSPPRELQEEMTTPTTTIPAPTQTIKPRNFAAPVGGGMILVGKQLDVNGEIEMHFRMPEPVPKELMALLLTQNAESWKWEQKFETEEPGDFWTVFVPTTKEMEDAGKGLATPNVTAKREKGESTSEQSPDSCSVA